MRRSAPRAPTLAALSRGRAARTGVRARRRSGGRCRRPTSSRRSIRSSSGPIAFPAPTAPRIIVGVAPGADLDAVARSLRPYAARCRSSAAAASVALVASNAAAVADLAAHDPRIEFAEPDRRARDWPAVRRDSIRSPASPSTGSTTPLQAGLRDRRRRRRLVDDRRRRRQRCRRRAARPGRRVCSRRTTRRGSDGTVFDSVGHGTFVAGLIAMVDGNGIGAKGVAGATRVLPVRASVDGSFTDDATVRGHHVGGATTGRGVINLSLEARATIRRSTGRSTTRPRRARSSSRRPATRVTTPATRSTTRRRTSEDRPGAAAGASASRSERRHRPTSPRTSRRTTRSCRWPRPARARAGATARHGDFSTIPVSTNTTEWDDATDSCNNVFQPDPTPGAGRWAYGEGTSFSAPIVSAVAALVRQANTVLTPAQVADVIRRSATQTFGTGWNEYTGAGIVESPTPRLRVARTLRHDAADRGVHGGPEGRRHPGRPDSPTDVADPGKTVAGARDVDARGVA